MNNIHMELTFSDPEFINDTILYADKYKEKKHDTTLTVSPMDAYVYQGNLFGLFKSMGVPDAYHVLLMQYNGYTNPHDYDGKQLVFTSPTENIFDKMYKLR